MRIAKVIGSITLGRRLENFPAGQLVLVDVLDAHALSAWPTPASRSTAMPESLVVFDQFGAGVGQLIGVSEGAEATMPFRPKKVPLDAYNAAILDHVQITR